MQNKFPLTLLCRCTSSASSCILANIRLWQRETPIHPKCWVGLPGPRDTSLKRLGFGRYDCDWFKAMKTSRNVFPFTTMIIAAASPSGSMICCCSDSLFSCHSESVFYCMSNRSRQMVHGNGATEWQWAPQHDNVPCLTTRTAQDLLGEHNKKPKVLISIRSSICWIYRNQSESLDPKIQYHCPSARDTTGHPLEVS